MHTRPPHSSQHAHSRGPEGQPTHDRPLKLRGAELALIRCEAGDARRETHYRALRVVHVHWAARSVAHAREYRFNVCFTVAARSRAHIAHHVIPTNRAARRLTHG